MDSHRQQEQNGRLFYGGGIGGGCSLMSFVVVFAMIVMMMIIPSCEASDPCSNPVIVDDAWRNVSHTEGTSTDHCDKDVFSSDRWYTFRLYGEKATIPTNCIKNNKCGSEIAMRINLMGRSLPTEVGDNITAVVCGSYDVLGKYDCCVLGTEVTIAKCANDTIVYRFSPSFADRCPVALCTQKRGYLVPSEVTAKSGDIHPASVDQRGHMAMAPDSGSVEDQVEHTSPTDQDTLPTEMSMRRAGGTDSVTTVDSGGSRYKGPYQVAAGTTTADLVSIREDVTEAEDYGMLAPMAYVELATSSGQSTPETTISGAVDADASQDVVNATSVTQASVLLPHGADPESGNENSTDSTAPSTDLPTTTQTDTSPTISTLRSIFATLTPPSGQGDPYITSSSNTTFLNTTSSSVSSFDNTAPVSTSLTATSSSHISSEQSSLSVTSSGITSGEPEISTSKKLVVPTMSFSVATTPSIVTTIKREQNLGTSSSASSSATDRSEPKKSTEARPNTRQTTSTSAAEAISASSSSSTLSSSSPPALSSALPAHTSLPDKTTGPQRPSISNNDFIMIEMVRLVFKGSYEGQIFANNVYGMMESFLRRATRQEQAKDGTDWWFEMSSNLHPITFKNTTTYLDFQIKHTAQTEIFYMFRRLQLEKFISQNSNLTLLTTCRPSQNCQEDSFVKEPLLSVFEKHAPVFVTVITLCSVCVGVLVLGMLCARCRRRGTWRANPDLENKTLADNRPYFNGNQSPFTDAQIMKDEVGDNISVNGSAKDGDDNNMENKDNTWVIPLDDVVADQDGIVAKTTEDTRL